mgnify:CR=1 FL=1
MNDLDTDKSKRETRLNLPINKAYIHIACMTADAISKELKLNTKKSEEIKAAVFDAYFFIINNEKIFDEKTFLLEFIEKNESISINFGIKAKSPDFILSSGKHSDPPLPFEASFSDSNSFLKLSGRLAI